MGTWEWDLNLQPMPKGGSKKTKGVALWPRPVEVLFLFLVKITGV